MSIRTHYLALNSRKRREDNQRRRQRGVTVFEYVLWAALAAVVIYGAVSKYGPANHQQKVDNEVGNIQTIWTSVSRLRDSSGYAGITTAVLQTSRGFPSGMTGAKTGTVLNSWNGTVTVTGTADQFTIAYADVPAEACVLLRPKLETTGSFYSVSTCPATGVSNLTMSSR